jgi:hypothetical protein
MRSLSTAVRDLLPPSMSIPVVDAARRTRVWAGRARLWGWKLFHLAPREGSRFDVDFLGREDVAWRVWTNLGLPAGLLAARALPVRSEPHTVLVSELPLPGSLRIPWELHMVVPFGRTLEEIAAGYDGELRRRLRRLKERLRVRRVEAPAEVDRVNREMLVPYALARHGQGAYLMGDDDVRRMALRTGRLDLVSEGDAAVACHLGYDVVRHGRRYCVTRLFGYPERVFSNPRRLRDVNSANTWLAMTWAHENGYDFYDMGACHARPDDGLLQWKRRRGGNPDLLRNDGFFHLRLPREDEAHFLWESPVFAVERGRLVLHVGVPVGPSDAEVESRYRELAFGGLAAVRVHWAGRRGAAPYGMLRATLARQAPSTAVELAFSS